MPKRAYVSRHAVLSFVDVNLFHCRRQNADERKLYAGLLLHDAPYWHYHYREERVAARLPPTMLPATPAFSVAPFLHSSTSCQVDGDAT